MRFWILVLPVVWGMSGIVLAQGQGQKKGRGGPPPEEILGASPEVLKEELALTDDAYATVTELYNKTVEAINAISESGKKKEFGQLREAARSRLADSLTVELKERYLQFIHFKDMARDIDLPTATFRRDLQAGDDQMKRIYQLVEDDSRRLRLLSDEAKTKEEKERVKAESKKIKAELKEKILAELTLEQREKLDTVPSERGVRSADQILQRLDVDDSKKEDVRKALIDVIDGRRKWEDEEKALRKELERSIEGDSDIESKLEEIRTKRQEHESTIRTLQKTLRELCTPRQQAILIVEKILAD